MRFLHCSDVHITADYPRCPAAARLAPLDRPVRALAWAGRAKAYAQRPGHARRHRPGHEARGGPLHPLRRPHRVRAGGRVPGARARSGAGRGPAAAAPSSPATTTSTPRAPPQGPLRALLRAPDRERSARARREGAFPFVRLVGEGAAVVGLSSARVPLMPGFSYGPSAPRSSSAWRGSSRTRGSRAGRVLVVVHHAPLGSTAARTSYLHGLWDAEELFALVPGPRFAVLHGHIHRRYHHPASDTRPHVFGAGSSTQAGREGYWIIETRRPRRRRPDAPGGRPLLSRRAGGARLERRRTRGPPCRLLPRVPQPSPKAAPILCEPLAHGRRPARGEPQRSREPGADLRPLASRTGSR